MEDGKLGKYEIRGTLGKGAMGTVYEGWDPIIRRRVAIKTVRLPEASDADAQEELARFRIEAQAGGQLNHPNICGIFDYGETTTFAYIVMEYIDGHTLKSSLDKEERFPIPETVRIMEELLAGLQFSHDRKVVHRDIKPANIMLTTDGKVKIADFGIARIESSNLTQAGAVLGTPAYMSPEQFMGAAIDARTDIYASGVVLYQMLTGERPFEGGFSAIMHKALNTQPPRPSDLSVTVPAGFDGVVARAMAKRPDERYATAAEFSRAIRAALDAPAVAVPPDMAETQWGDVTVNTTLNATLNPTLAAADAQFAGRTGTAAGDDVALMTALSTTRTGSQPPPQPGVPTGGTAGPPAPGPNRLKLYAGLGVLAAVLAGAGGWFAMRPAATPAKTEFMVAEGPRTGQSAPTAVAPSVAPPAVAVAPAAVPTIAVAPTATPPAAASPNATPLTVAAAVPPVVAAPPVQPVTSGAPPPAAAVPTQLAMNPVPPPPPPSPVAVPKAALAAALAAVPCSMVGGDVTEPDEIALLTGLAHAGAPEAAVRRAIADTAPGISVDWHVVSFDGPYCRALDILRPLATRFAAPSSGFVLALAGDKVRLQDGELITLHLTTPDFPAYLQVDYLQHDGSVYHMHPTPTDPSRLYPAGSRQSLGDPTVGGAQWAVSEPYGTEIITAVASSVPLFAKSRPESETNDAYLRDLQTALDAAKKKGARLAVGAVILDTEPKKAK